MTIQRAHLLGVAIFATACGKSDAAKFADSYCSEVAKCCAQAGMTGAGQLCKLLFTSGGYNAAAGDECLSDMRAQVAAGTFCSSGATSQACSSVISTGGGGSKPPGEGCEFDNDCASSTEGPVVCRMAYDGDDWIHKCQVQIPGKAGDGPCLGTRDGAMLSYETSSSADILPRGYVCDTADGVKCSSGACVALAAVGESCTSSTGCIRSAYCDDSRHCTTRLSAGAACAGSDRAECADGFFCPEASPRQCTAKLANGGTCTSDFACMSGNCSGATCAPNAIEQLGWGLLCS